MSTSDFGAGGGFGWASVAAGLVPAWFRIIGRVGGALLIVASIPVKAGTEGSAATMVWLVFLAVLGTRMWRQA
jgi:hypothetical protein